MNTRRISVDELGEFIRLLIGYRYILNNQIKKTPLNEENAFIIYLEYVNHVNYIQNYIN